MAIVKTLRHFKILATFIAALTIIAFYYLWDSTLVGTKAVRTCRYFQGLDVDLCLQTHPLKGGVLREVFGEFLTTDFEDRASAHRENFNMLSFELVKHKESFVLSSKKYIAARFVDPDFIPEIEVGSLLGLKKIRRLSRYGLVFLKMNQVKNSRVEEMDLYHISDSLDAKEVDVSESKQPINLAESIKKSVLEGFTSELEEIVPEGDLIRDERNFKANENTIEDAVSEYKRRIELIKNGDKSLLAGLGLSQEVVSKTWDDLDCVPRGRLFASSLKALKIPFRIIGSHAYKDGPDLNSHTLIEYYDTSDDKWFLVDPTLELYEIVAKDSKLDFIGLRRELLAGESIFYKTFSGESKELGEEDFFSPVKMFSFYVLAAGHISYEFTLKPPAK